MLYLICGTPGSGKTLWTLSTVEKRRQDDKRAVFQSGIPDLKIPWEPLTDPQKWAEVPDNSIVVIDEAQRVFPIRKQASSVPAWVSAFETHRHRGIDVYLITQDPHLIDSHVRKLVGEYRYLDRPFGQPYCVVWRFAHVCDWKASQERLAAVKDRWKYPVDAFAWYKSAEAHTHKRTIPKYLFYVPVLLLLIGGSVYAVLHVLTKSRTNATASGPISAAAPGAGGPLDAAATKRKTEAEKLAYLVARTPRLDDAPESAPIYDELTKPVTFPRIAACVQMEGRACQCFTDQATPIFSTDEFCRAYVVHGSFDSTRAGIFAGRRDRDAAGGQRAEGGAPIRPTHDQRGEAAQASADRTVTERNAKTQEASPAHPVAPPSRDPAPAGSQRMPAPISVSSTVRR